MTISKSHTASFMKSRRPAERPGQAAGWERFHGTKKPKVLTISKLKAYLHGQRDY